MNAPPPTLPMPHSTTDPRIQRNVSRKMQQCFHQNDGLRHVRTPAILKFKPCAASPARSVDAPESTLAAAQLDPHYLYSVDQFLGT